VGGPFRFEPPSTRDGLVVRSRLLERMALRWQRRVVTVAASPGFGKTALLVSAMAQPLPTADCVDVWLSCEATDADATQLLADLGRALGVPDCQSIADLTAAVWMWAPGEVCLVLDDAHEIPPASDGARALGELVASLPRNGHVVVGTRGTVPFPVARLASQRELEQIRESDLAFDASELASFAAARRVDVQVLSSSGGWPAVAELAATAGSDLVFEYVWEEILSTLGDARAHELARLAVAGNADDLIAEALVPGAGGAEALVAGVPLVERTATGWVALHPLWHPVLRRLLPEVEADECRSLAAVVHRDADRHDAAINLFVEAQAWEEVLLTIRLAELSPGMRGDAGRFGRWYRLLPPAYRGRPIAQFAAAIELSARAPLAASSQLVEAATGFRADGDVDGEVAAIFHDGLLRWWANDIAGLATLYERVAVLAADGSHAAATLASIATAAIGHVNADSPSVLQALSDVDEGVLDPGWRATANWLRSVAHRRAGDLDLAEVMLDADREASGDKGVAALARLRIAWLRGDVDLVLEHLVAAEQKARSAGQRYPQVEVGLELAAHLAWLGRADPAQQLLDEIAKLRADMPGALVHIMRLIALASIAVAQGDEPAAASHLADDPHTRPGRADNWYWRDRTAVALPYVLLPETRHEWDAQTQSAIHRVGIELGRALVAARANDLSVVRALQWPEPGLARVHLPLAWLAELVAAGAAAGNPPPPALPEALGDQLRFELERLAIAGSTKDVTTEAARLADRLPSRSPHTLSISVLGPLELRIDDVIVEHSDLGRRRVRELLCLLVIRRRLRRDVIADILWPELVDPRHNLRVTLSYLLRILEPQRRRNDAGFFVRTDNETVWLSTDHRLRCDVWELDAHLEVAADAERVGDPTAALLAYQKALPLWRGDPYDDVAAADWARDAQTYLRNRYTVAAVRAGELLLARGAARDASRAGEHAVRADPMCEPAYQLLVRSLLAMGDRRGAESTLDACFRMLVELALEPSPATTDLSAALRRNNEGARA
jgi:ATP/maltotriose-dependent transcriptional regulator MalT/DNA-binding SARP family transcriptional activator